MYEAVKLVLIDLDNTLWHGTLLEDGLHNLKLNYPLLESLKELDDKGILLAVVSKNNASDVNQALMNFNISSLFTMVAASFEPKSKEIHNILRLMRFSPDACLFIDDSIFEREEVSYAFSEIRTVSPEEFNAITYHQTQWSIASSKEEGVRRKQFYISEKERIQEELDYKGTYREFIHEIGLTIKIAPASLQSAARICEIAQRTNQLNFSTNRYKIEDIQALLASLNHECYIVIATDKFGDYGIVGFASLRYDENQVVIQDLMLSCRIQGKSAEHAIISVLAEQAKKNDGKKLLGLYKPTRKNGQLIGIFEKLGFEKISDTEDYIHYHFDLINKSVPRPSHLRVVVSNQYLDVIDKGIPFVRDIVQQQISKNIIAGNILDIGAGWDGVLGEDCDAFLEINDNKHIRLDMDRYPRTDIIANAQNMYVVTDESVDSVLCLEVLEHCTDPFALSRELIRVLRTDGYAVISAPMNFVIHDTPGDYWRFTPDGLKLLFKNHAEFIGEFIEGDSDHPIRTVLVLKKL